MKISYNWLKKLIPVAESPEKVAQLLTASGLEVEGIETYELVEGGLQKVVIGEVLTCEKHPDAERLSLTTVDIGLGNPLAIVCGAPNVAAGQKVVVACVGAKLFPTEGEPFEIKKSKIRGQLSEGMICAEDEIGLGKSHAGIMVLDTILPNGTPAAQYFKLESDAIFEIGLTPNRADAASHLGVARDLKAILNRPLSTYEVPEIDAAENTLAISVQVENEIACPRYSGISISGVQVKPSPEWLQLALKSIGLSPINNIVDVTNYVLHELGQPMHAFDAAKISGNKIIVKQATKGEKFTTLDGVERTLTSEDLMICDIEKALALGGIFGGLHSGISENTKHIFLESAYFDAAFVRKSAQHHNLKTDSSFRFERGTDVEMTTRALKKAVSLILEVAGGKVSSSIVDVYPNPLPPFEIQASYDRIQALIGIEIPKETIHSILENLDIKIVPDESYGHPGFESGFTAVVPRYRVDVLREADLVEEILRIYGLDNVPLSAHLGSSFLAETNGTDRDKKFTSVSKMLSANGFYEIITNSLTNPAHIGWLEELGPDYNVPILNRLSEDLGVMRQSLLFSGLEALAYNLNRKQKNLKLFELGKTYRKNESDFEEKYQLALYLTGAQHDESWEAKAAQTSFFDIKAKVEQVLKSFNFQFISTQPSEYEGFAYGLNFIINNQIVAKAGMVLPKLAAAFGVKQSVLYAELEWDYLLKKSKSELVYKEISRFPEVRRDLSLVLNKDISFNQIQEKALKVNKKLIRELNVFDVYTGANIGEDKKSYSISFTLQDDEQTLNEAQIDKTMERLIQVFENDLGAIIRK